MAEQQTEQPVATTETQVKMPVLMGDRGLECRSIEDMYRLAQAIARSQFAPKDMRQKPDDVFCAIQLGAELGVSPMQAIQNIAVINGRPSVWGDLMLAIVMRHTLLFAQDSYKEWHEGTPGEDDWTGACRCRRIGQAEAIERRFSMEEAKQAGLINRKNYKGEPVKTVWDTMPKRMLQMRARAFALRDCFPDVLKGLYSREEMQADELLGQLDLGDESDTPQPTAAERLEQTVKRKPTEPVPPPQPAGDDHTPRAALPIVGAGSGETMNAPSPESSPPAALGTPTELSLPPAPDLSLLRAAIKGKYAGLSKAAKARIDKNFGLATPGNINDIEMWANKDDLDNLRDAIEQEVQSK